MDLSSFRPKLLSKYSSVTLGILPSKSPELDMFDSTCNDLIF